MDLRTESTRVLTISPSVGRRLAPRMFRHSGFPYMDDGRWAEMRARRSWRCTRFGRDPVARDDAKWGVLGLEHEIGPNSPGMAVAARAGNWRHSQ
jgi:hypothetical protein